MTIFHSPTKVSFFSSLSVDTLVSTRNIHASSFTELHQNILKLMGAGEHYACFTQDGGRVVALDRSGRMVML